MPRKSKIGKTGKRKGKKYGRTRKNRSRRYRGGCEKCTGSEPSGAGLWTSGPIRGGTNPEQISKDIYNYKTDPYFYSSS
jgi:hypothetical protein